MKKIRLSDLEKVAKVTINDLTDYVDGQENTGGRYAYRTHFNRISWNKWAVTYSNSSDFFSCPYCGNWGDACGCDRPQVISSLELLLELSSIEEKEDFFLNLF